MNSIIDIIEGIMPLNPFATGLIGFITGWGLLYWRYRVHHPDLCKNTLLSAQEKLNATELQISELRKTNHRIQTQLAVSESRRDQSQKLATDLSNDVEIHRQMVAQLKLTQMELSTRIELERKTSDEKIRLLENAERRFTLHFESLANGILQENSKKFSEQHNRNLDNIVHPLREQIKEFRKKIDDVYVNDSKDRTSLRDEIKNLRLRTEKISEDAINLTQALRGDKKVQGKLGGVSS